MNLPRSLACLGITSLLAAPSPSEACRCLPPKPPAESFAEAGAVFRGRVVSTATETPPGGSAYDARLIARFEVSTAWKGPATREVLVDTHANGGLCGYRFQVGTEYVVYAEVPARPKKKKGGKAGAAAPALLTTHLCTRTREASSSGAAEDLKWLGQREPLRPPSR